MANDMDISRSVDMLSNRLDMLYSSIRLYADIAYSCPHGNYTLQTTVTDLSRIMANLANQVQEISCLANAIQNQIYKDKPATGTNRKI